MESVGRSKSKTKKTADAAIKYIILIVVGLLMIYPLLWLMGASFKENNEIFSSVGIIPKKIRCYRVYKRMEDINEVYFYEILREDICHSST